MKKILILLAIFIWCSILSASNISIDYDINLTQKYIDKGVNLLEGHESILFQPNIYLEFEKYKNFSIDINYYASLSKRDDNRDFDKIDTILTYSKIKNSIKYSVAVNLSRTIYDALSNDNELILGVYTQKRYNPYLEIAIDIHENQNDNSVGNLYISSGISNSFNIKSQNIDFSAVLSFMKRSKESSNSGDDIFKFSDLNLEFSKELNKENITYTPSLIINIPFDEKEVQKDIDIFLNLNIKF